MPRTTKLPLPKNWTPDEPDKSYALEKGLFANEIAAEAERFMNHARQIDRKCVSWSAAWRNWVLKAVEYRGRDKPQAAQPCQRPGIYLLRSDPRFEAWEQATGKTYPVGGIYGGWWFPSAEPPKEEDTNPFESYMK